ncbi:MAG: glucose-6-phosphate isomerase [Deltaproteobacteria bacterium]|nr:glucose-6-phosphate isomerase [Deltaproteobacteria bacterium]MBW2074916.1 glucose-6-phosphate isomerase [Deltaproteobacteria bacterium]RLB80770.1 MAG: glucose-6-phosphate isomerase [Deltaproteobacteria bacterium]
MKRWEDKSWTRAMRIMLDFSGMMADAVGHRHGLTVEQVNSMEHAFEAVHKHLKQQRRAGHLPFYELPYDDETLKVVLKAARKVVKRCENFVVLGIGGSALGGIALFRALRHPHHNLMPQAKRKGLPRVFFADNIDPEGFSALLNIVNLEKTVFNVISKSGGTAETMSQFLIVRNKLIRKLGRKRHTAHIIATTDPERGYLRAIAREQGYETLPIHPGVGGRFSVLSPVGLLPAAVAGIDIEELLAGARNADKTCKQGRLWKNPAGMNAALQVLAYTVKKKPISVMMPYSDALRDVADWYRQIWAESLGKRVDLRGRVVHVGPTPVKALGVTDQHSQLQLYMEGPFDKVITFLTVEKFRKTIKIPASFSHMDGIGYLGRHTLNALIQAEGEATRSALTQARRIHTVIKLPEINPFTVGQLLFLLEVQTLYAGGLLGINPLDQPGVEAGKQLTYGMMGRKGFEDRAQMIALKPQGIKRYRIAV